MQAVLSKSFSPQFANQMNRLNDEFIELEIRITRDLLRFVDAHKPTRGDSVEGTLS